MVGVSALLRRVPLRPARAFGRLLGYLGWHVLRSVRREALENVAIAFPDWPDERRRDTIRAMFAHLGTTLMEVLWLPNLDAASLARTTTFEGVEHLRSEDGMIAITGHCGNWEWVAHAIASLTPLTVLQRERNEPEMNALSKRLRAHSGITTIDRGSTAAAREMIRALRKPGLLAFLVDQNIRADSVKVPFFGRPALTPIGPARLAVRTATPIVCIFIERRDGMHHVRILEPIRVSKDDDPVAITARLTAEVEAQIRRAPEQWVWMHQRWRERPDYEV